MKSTRKPGRPRLPENLLKSSEIRLAFTPSDLRELSEHCQKIGIPTAVFVRAAAMSQMAANKMNCGEIPKPLTGPPKRKSRQPKRHADGLGGAYVPPELRD